MLSFLPYIGRALIGTVILLSPVLCTAQDVVPMRGPGGADGVWFPLPEAQIALAALSEVEPMRTRLHLCSVSLTLADSQAEEYRAVIAGAATEIEAAATRLEEALARAVRAEIEANQWYRSPWLWGLVGLIVGGGGVLAAVLGAGA